jgi:selenocysteine lyase/cysteine desulfurase
VGAIRASLGIATNQADLDRFLEVLASFQEPARPGRSGGYS